jgi:hypothetical protein
MRKKKTTGEKRTTYTVTFHDKKSSAMIWESDEPPSVFVRYLGLATMKDDVIDLYYGLNGHLIEYKRQNYVCLVAMRPAMDNTKRFVGNVLSKLILDVTNKNLMMISVTLLGIFRLPQDSGSEANPPSC